MPALPNPAAQINLTQACLRANPAYELVLFDRLSAKDRETLDMLSADPECYGVLRHREDPGRSLKAVSHDTALLLFALKEAGRLPRYAIRELGDKCTAVVSKMILDDVLEIESNGVMLSGPAAGALLYGAEPATGSETTLATISRRALEYAASLALESVARLSSRLYAYNTLPASRRWRETLPSETATASYLGLAGGRAAQAMSHRWRPLPESPAWISWRARSVGPKDPSLDKQATASKLYVSPACDQLRDAVQAIAEVIANSNAEQWKIGKGIHGLLRPDKIVIYLNSFADLQEIAVRLMDRLSGCEAHGVPFTAELAGNGLLSWGIDPPSEANNAPWFEGGSWRSRLCDRLAMALIQAGQSTETKSTGNTNHDETVRFALQRLRLEGIDTSTWTPAIGLTWEN
jgi:hypothetical protein